MRLLSRLLAWLLPATGTRRRAPAPTTAPAPRHRRAITPPRHLSPYAVDAATDTTLYLDPPLWNTCRPYVFPHARMQPLPPEQAAQAHRRWTLEMALRGRDVGAEVIHGVRVGTTDVA